MVKYLTVKQVIMINAMVIQKHTPSEEVRVSNHSLLESAIHRPQQSAFGKDAYDTIWLKAAALFHSLAMNHPFVNGNKRTAFASLYQFLWINGFKLTASEQNAEDFTLKMVNKKPSMRLAMIAKWIERNTKKRY